MHTFRVQSQLQHGGGPKEQHSAGVQKTASELRTVRWLAARTVCAAPRPSAIWWRARKLLATPVIFLFWARLCYNIGVFSPRDSLWRGRGRPSLAESPPTRHQKTRGGTRRSRDSRADSPARRLPLSGRLLNVAEWPAGQTAATGRRAGLLSALGEQRAVQLGPVGAQLGPVERASLACGPVLIPSSGRQLPADSCQQRGTTMSGQTKRQLISARDRDGFCALRPRGAFGIWQQSALNCASLAQLCRVAARPAGPKIR